MIYSYVNKKIYLSKILPIGNTYNAKNRIHPIVKMIKIKNVIQLWHFMIIKKKRIQIAKNVVMI